MKRLCIFLLSMVLAVSMAGAAAAATTAGIATPSVNITANGVYLYNIDTDTLIYEKNADERMVPASLTKIMTCILVLENTDDLDAEILTYPNYIQDYLYNYQYGPDGVGEVSKGGLLAGEQLTMREMLYALMLPSANEAAMIIADHIGGSQEGFAEMMNQRAKQLGATNTNFANPNGLYDANHYTTPRDMFLITMHAMELPGFMDIVSTTAYTSSPTNLHSDGLVWNTTNYMMVPTSDYYYPSIRGIKTGTLPQSGRCFISSATKDGYTYVAVVMGSDLYDGEGNMLPQNMAFTDTKNLYEWVFNTYRQKTVLQQGKIVYVMDLKLSGERDYLQLMASEKFSYLLPEGIDVENDIKREYDVPDFVKAPVEKYDPVGWVVLKLNNEEIGRVELLAAETIGASTALVVLDNVRNVTRSFWFKFVFIFFILLIVAYAVLMVTRNRRRRSSGGNYKPRRRV